VATDPQPAISEEHSGYAPPVLDLIAAASLVALSVWVMIEAARMEVPGALATAPGLLPFLSAASLAVMAIALGWLAWRRRAAGITVAGPPGHGAEVRRAAVLFAIVGCYLLALQVLSFDYALSVAGTRLVIGSFELVSIVVLTALLGMFWGRSLALCALVAAGWILALSGVFRYFFKLPLPG
jgi:hypothetical protein